jgi:hypothetical protein
MSNTTKIDRLLDQLAEDECELVNALGREDARKSGDWETRAWLHPEDWVAMRSPVVVLLGLMKLDGRITEAEDDAFEAWAESWLDRTEWGDTYRDSKARAIVRLGQLIQIDETQMRACAAQCGRRLSDPQKIALVESIDELIEAGDHRGFAYDLRAAVLLGSGLIGHSQKMTVAARATAEKKTVGQRS